MIYVRAYLFILYMYLQWDPLFWAPWDQKACPDLSDVLISGVDVLWYLVPVACVHNRKVSTIQGSRIGGLHCALSDKRVFARPKHVLTCEDWFMLNVHISTSTGSIVYSCPL